MTIYGTHIGRNPKLTAGDPLQVKRNITMPTGRTVTKAYFTVKKLLTQTDAEAALQKEIDGTDTPNVGHVSDDGTDGEATILFDLTASETGTLGSDTVYNYDIAVILDGGEPFTVEVGTLSLSPGVTDATS